MLCYWYLLPCALGQSPAVPGVINDDGAAATSSCHPWKLLKCHRRTDDDGAYFFERMSSNDYAKCRARQARSYGSHWTWTGQRRLPDEALHLPGGEQVLWGKYALNLQECRTRRGSTGWVLHEYTVALPKGPSPVKVCHVAFTGRRWKRQLVPEDDDEGEGQELEPQAAPHQHKRTATASSVITTVPSDQEQRFLNYGTSSVGDFFGSDAEFSQESSVLDPNWCAEGGSSNQKPFTPDQELA